jgi:hypothetical protein
MDEFTWSGENKLLDISGFNAGMYIFTIQSEGVTEVKKVVVQ